ncbi:MAG: ATP-binding protein [Firmicutes bacterium]|nr:ATP-binding protein [Bacillota bacterium]
MLKVGALPKNSIKPRLPYAQIIAVFIAFVLMVIPAYFLAVDIESANLDREAEATLKHVESHLNSELNATSATLKTVSETAVMLIEDNQAFEKVATYINTISDFGRETDFTSGFQAVFGMFWLGDNAVESKYELSFSAENDFNPFTQPWYSLDSEEKNSEVIFTSPYIGARADAFIITATRNIYHENGRRMGIVCIDINVASLYGASDSYTGQVFKDYMLFDSNRTIMAHYDGSLIGSQMDSVNGGLKEMASLIKNGKKTDAILRANNHKGEDRYFAVSKMSNGWYLGISTPVASYTGSIRLITVFLSILGACLAVVLSAFLVSIALQKHKIEKSLRGALVEAQNANTAKTAFLANMSHEVRTPMNSIVGFAELASLGELPPQTAEYLSSIRGSANYLLRIINDILDIAKIETGKTTLDQIPFDLSDVFAHCKSLALPRAEDKDITLYCYAEPPQNKKLVGDPIRLRQALMNLLHNAVKFTDNEGTVKFLASIKRADATSATIDFEVKDTGIGMTKEQIAKIFEPFAQADESVTRKYGGTGLGLPIAKNIIELMGGELKVESEIGRGTRFHFTITFDLADSADIIAITAKSPHDDLKKPNFAGEVLICEDNELNRQVICDHLSRVGLKTVVATNGKEGVDIVAKRVKSGVKPFDLIFMDIHMPVMDGLEASAKILWLGSKAPIVALTANVMTADIESYQINGMVACLGKPFTAQELWRCLAKYLPIVDYSLESEETSLAREDELKKRLKLNFLKSNTETYAQIQESLVKGDIKTAHRLAHTLKSNAGQIGETRLHGVALTLESALKEGKNLASEKQLSEVETELKAVFKKLEPMLNEESTASHKTAGQKIKDSGQILALLEKLAPLVEDSDIEALNYLDELKSIDGAEPLAHHIEEYEFLHAIKAIAELKKKLSGKV